MRNAIGIRIGISSEMVGPRGFEPPTYWPQTSRATKLRYGPTGVTLPRAAWLRKALDESSA